MIDLSKTFLQCMHCHHNFAEPRHVCPACDWPRTHSEETPPPSWSQPDPNAGTAQPAAQVQVGIINADPTPTDATAETVLVEIHVHEPAPQAALGILADIPVPQVKARRGTLRTLTLAPEDPTGEAK